MQVMSLRSAGSAYSAVKAIVLVDFRVDLKALRHALQAVPNLELLMLRGLGIEKVPCALP